MNPFEFHFPEFDPTNVSGHYVLNANNEVCEERDLRKAAQWWKENRGTRDRVGYTVLDEAMPLFVSTVFLGMEHGFGRMLMNLMPGEPHLPQHVFETMIFAGTRTWPGDDPLLPGRTVNMDLHGFQRRYGTWAQAEAGHAYAVKVTERWLRWKKRADSVLSTIGLPE